MTSVSQDRRFGVNSSMAIKVPVRAATTANVTLEGEQTIDGVSCVTDDRVLVKNQTTGADNGVYVVDSGTWERALDFDGVYDVIHGTIIYVTSGTVSAGLFYVLTTSDPITVATTSLSFSVVTPSSSITLPLALAQGGTAATSAISGLSSLGVIQVTGEAGTANSQTGTIDALVTSLRADQLFLYVPSVTNTAATTLTLTPSGSSALAAKNVFSGGAALVGGELVLGVPSVLHYDGTQLNIIGSAPFVDTRPIVVGSADATKKLRFEVDGFTTVTTRTWTWQNSSDTVVGKDTTDVLTNKTLTAPTINTSVSGTAVATQAQMESASSTSVIVSPGRQQFHPCASKAWVKWDSGGSISASYNVSSITDNGAGTFVVNFTTSFSGTSFGINAVAQDTNPPVIAGFGTVAVGSCVVNFRVAAGTLTDSAGTYSASFFGDQ